jgi:phage/plasmid-associated DNA primase
MRSRRNLEGVLAWAVRGAGEWYTDRNSGLATPEIVYAETNRTREELDTVGQWIEESLELNVGKDWHIANADLYQHYSNWCDDNGVSPKQKRSLTQSLNNKGIAGPNVLRHMGKTIRAWIGIRWQ